jgi:hypothetical protein
LSNSDPFEDAERLALAATANPKLIPQYLEATKTAQALEGAPGWKGKRGKMTQVEIMLNHLQKNGSITQREAFLDYGIQSFHRRITDLKDIGVILAPERKKHKVTGQEYTRYHYLGLSHTVS